MPHSGQSLRTGKCASTFGCKLGYIARGAIDTSVLSQLQKLARSGHLATIMASFVQWLAAEAKANKLTDSIDGVLEFVNYWDVHRHELSYETDGVVVKVNSLFQQAELGFTSKAPRWAMAYKFKAEQVSTRLEHISYQVGRTGAITPVANLQPVELAGTVVKRASLHNADQIEKLDVRVGDWVYVEKGGEIIPKIYGSRFRPSNS